VNRERMTRAALLAHPLDVRDGVGGEMTATLLDVSAGSRTRFTRELAGLVRAGLRVRGQRKAANGARRTLADGLCLAGVWFMTLDLSTLLAQTVRGFHDPLLAPWSLVLLGVALALALVGHDRLAGVAALAWTATRFPLLMDHHPGMGAVVLAVTLPSVACFAALAVAPRRRAPDPRRLAWLVVPGTLVATFGPPPYDQSPLLLALVTIAVVLVVAYALMTLTTDPRVAIAGAIPLATVTAGSAALLTLIALLVLATAVVRSARLGRRRAPI
jgi:hypothetical protein